MAEAAELPGTFGLARERVRAGSPAAPTSQDGRRGRPAGAEADLADLASPPRTSSWPWRRAAARRTRWRSRAAARRAGARGGGGRDRDRTHRWRGLADVAVEVEVGPEVLRGSTRLTAGTAQKVVLNALTTAAMVRLGRVHGDLMVDVEAANTKLRQRAAGIVAEIAGCSTDSAAARPWRACGGNARAAVRPPGARAWTRPRPGPQAGRFITLRDSLRPEPLTAEMV